MEKKTKYDTNPLDPDFVRRTDEMRGSTSDVGQAGATDEQTRRIGSGDVDMEAPTRYYPSQPHPPQPSTPQPQAFRAPTPQDSRPFYPAQYASRYDDAGGTSYPSIFIPPAYRPPQAGAPQMPYAQPQAGVFQQPQRQPPSSRTVQSIHLPENLAMILPYLPFPLIGVVPGLVELLLVPRNETRVRFHAAQGLALHAAVLVIGTLFSTAEGIISSIMRGPFPLLLGLASTLFTIATTVYFIISMIRVWKGKPHHIAPLADITRWFEEKLEPKK